MAGPIRDGALPPPVSPVPPAGPTFELRAVVHLIRPWGTPARDLEQLREGIAAAPDEVLFCHAVQYELRHPAADELPADDFSHWVGAALQDGGTAERLSFAVQGRGPNAGALREALLGVLDAVPKRRRAEAPADAGPGGEEYGGGAFHFLAALSQAFPTGAHVRDGHELVPALLEADASTWFLHLVEEPWAGDGRAPLLEWLEARGEARLAGWLREAAGSGLPLEKARTQLHRRWRRSTIARRVARVANAPEEDRREAGRRAIAGLLHRSDAPDAGDAPGGGA